MIEVVGREDCVTYLKIEKCEYADLIATRERMVVLLDYMKSAEYPNDKTIKTILGIKEVK